MCGIPLRSRTTFTSFLRPGTRMVPSVCASRRARVPASRPAFDAPGDDFWHPTTAIGSTSRQLRNTRLIHLRIKPPSNTIRFCAMSPDEIVLNTGPLTNSAIWCPIANWTAALNFTRSCVFSQSVTQHFHRLVISVIPGVLLTKGQNVAQRKIQRNSPVLR